MLSHGTVEHIGHAEAEVSCELCGSFTTQAELAAIPTGFVRSENWILWIVDNLFQLVCSQIYIKFVLEVVLNMMTGHACRMLQVGRMLFGGIGVRDQWNPLQAMFCIVLGIQGILQSYQAGVFMARYCGLLYQSTDQVLLSEEQCPDPAQLVCNAGGAGETRSGRSDNVSECEAECTHVQQGAKEHLNDGSTDGNELQLSDSRRVEQNQHEMHAGPHIVTKLPAQVVQVDAVSPNTADGSPSRKPPCNRAISLQEATGNDQGVDTGPCPFPAAVAGVAISLVSVTVVLVGLAAFGYSVGHDEWPGVLLAGALAPLGALARWQMAKWNSVPQRMS